MLLEVLHVRLSTVNLKTLSPVWGNVERPFIFVEYLQCAALWTLCLAWPQSFFVYSKSIWARVEESLEKILQSYWQTSPLIATNCQVSPEPFMIFCDKVTAFLLIPSCVFLVTFKNVNYKRAKQVVVWKHRELAFLGRWGLNLEWKHTASEPLCCCSQWIAAVVLCCLSTASGLAPANQSSGI